MNSANASYDVAWPISGDRHDDVPYVLGPCMISVPLLEG